LAAAGHRVLFTYREREAEAKALEQRIRDSGGEALSHGRRAPIGRRRARP
jgi:hypothetical protein